MSELIYHITTREAWLQARDGAIYRPASLETEGFIHFSTGGQLLATVQRIFGSRDDLGVLRIDCARLPPGLRYEEADVDVFPHFYGALPVAAVTGFAWLECDDDGSYVEPRAWVTGMSSRFVIDTPIGQMVGISDGDTLVGLEFDDQAQPTGPGSKAIVASLQAYFAGELGAFADLATFAEGTPFQRRVWRALRHIPAGVTRTYGEVASQLGQPDAARAVAAANASNPLAVVVPCHRVVGKDGGLTGYAWGLERKRWLLEHEGAVAQQRLW